MVAVQIMSEVPGLQHQAVQSALNVLQENGHVVHCLRRGTTTDPQYTEDCITQLDNC